MALSKGKSWGSFRERKEDSLEITIRELSSPWNFYRSEGSKEMSSENLNGSGDNPHDSTRNDADDADKD